ncbi:MAG: pilus assembly protein TadG-related protein [Gemmatimonadota bacterium]
MLSTIKRRASDERGATLLLVAGSMVALLSIVALAVDFGMLAVARTEAQRVADLSALAGAGALLQSPGNEELARAVAIDYAERNDVRHVDATLEPDDVEVDLANDRVTVTVYRIGERGNPVGTFFARVFGVNEVDISARATAEAAPAGGINCLLPLALPDRWEEAGGSENAPDDYNPEDGDTYVPWNPADPGAPYTGYTESDVGTEVIIKPAGGPGAMNPSWYFPWRPPGQQGGDDYRENIRRCVDPSVEYYVGQQVDTEPGNMIGPTKQGFSDLIAKDPHASWNELLNCVSDVGDKLSSDPAVCRGSPRVRAMPMFDPTEQPDPGKKPITLRNFAGVFVDRIEGNNVYAYFLGYSGIAPAGTPAGPTAGPIFKVLRLVE